MYGENSSAVRSALAELLQEHRIQRRNGVSMIASLPSNAGPAEHVALGQQMSRYRNAILAWSLQAIRTTWPSDDTRNVIATFEATLAAARNHSVVGPPSLTELTRAHPDRAVETWRLAARAAALSELDSIAGIGHDHLLIKQRRTVLKDAADVTRALVALDRRYESVSGWESLHRPRSLARSAEACAAYASTKDLDYRVDLAGWSPTPPLEAAPPQAGNEGFVAMIRAEQELLARLESFPNALSMRLVLDSQRIASHEAARRIRGLHPVIASRWTMRARSYTSMIRATRDVSGLIGAGSSAAAQASMVAALAGRLDTSESPTARTAQVLDRTFTHIDVRLAEIIEHGATQDLYVMRTTLPRLDFEAGGVVRQVRTRYLPLNDAHQKNLVEAARRWLRPAPQRQAAPTSAAQNRQVLEEAINARSSGQTRHQPLML